MRNIVKLIVVFMLASPSVKAELTDPEHVQVYLVPMADFPEPAAIRLAKIFSDDLGIWVKSSLKIGDIDPLLLPGTRQISAENAMLKAYPIVRRFPESSRSTVYVLLTTRDINTESGGFRFQFSMHNKESKMSIVSMARLIQFIDNKPVMNELVLNRFYKICKRAIGEQYFGWQRSSDINDVMYSPLMGIQDLDRIGMSHKETERQQSKKVESNGVSI